MDELLDPSATNSNNNQGGMQRQLPNATAVLVLGIVSIVGCILYGIPGLVCGIIALFLHKKNKAIYDANPSVYEMSYKNSKAGQICAIIGVILSALFLIWVVFFVIFALSNVGRYPFR